MTKEELKRNNRSLHLTFLLRLPILLMTIKDFAIGKYGKIVKVSAGTELLLLMATVNTGD